MIGTQLALIQRELWEHRSIFVTPLIMAVIVVLMSVTGQVAVSAFDEAVDLAILGASNLSDQERRAAISAIAMAITMLFLIAMAVLTIFYLLDALYTERKDKSILFWRSLPVSDAETVISKLLTALVAIPLITFVVVAVTHLVVLGISGIWLGSRGGDSMHLIWSSAPLAANWLATLILMTALPLWFLPFAGWFTFVSAWTKRSPFLMAFLPLIVLPMLERILIGTHLFRDAIFLRSVRIPLFSSDAGDGFTLGDASDMRIAPDADVTLLALLDLGRFFGHPGLWTGIAVGALFIAAAIYVRRYRDDS